MNKIRAARNELIDAMYSGFTYEGLAQKVLDLHREKLSKDLSAESAFSDLATDLASEFGTPFERTAEGLLSLNPDQVAEFDGMNNPGLSDVVELISYTKLTPGRILDALLDSKDGSGFPILPSDEDIQKLVDVFGSGEVANIGDFCVEPDTNGGWKVTHVDDPTRIALKADTYAKALGLAHAVAACE